MSRNKHARRGGLVWPPAVTRNWWLRVFPVMVFLCLGCSTYTILMDPPPSIPRSGTFQAGVGRADITPPAGCPMFGYSLPAKSVSRGFQTRLYARAFYLEGSNGEAVALVQCDLGAISALLHRQVAAKVVTSTGLSPDRILIAATHTHSAPGGFFESAFYNRWGSKENGFDPSILEFLSTQIAAAIQTAYAHRAHAAAALGECDIDSVTYNRSFAAYLANFDPPISAGDYDATRAVNKRFTMLRIDRKVGDGTVPLGAITNFAIHGTVIGPDNDLYSADCQGGAERYLEAAIRGRYHVPDSVEVLHALTNGMEGDAAPAFDRNARGFDEARRIGQHIAGKAFELFKSLDGHLTDSFPIGQAFREISMREATQSKRGTPLDVPHLGFPLAGGTEDGYSAFHDFWPGAEGSPNKGADFSLGPVGISLLTGPFLWNGRDSSKIFAFGGLHEHLIATAEFPQLMTVQVLRLGDLLLLCVPGEITTMMGRQVVSACSTGTTALGCRRTIVVALANQYMSYLTTPREYAAQHYEGASSIWGAHAGQFVGDQLAELTMEILEHKEPLPTRKWTFSPGNRTKFVEFEDRETESVRVECVVVDSTIGGQRIARCYFWDQEPAELDFTKRRWQIEDPGADGSWQTLSAVGPDSLGSQPVTDAGLELVVRSCTKEERKAITSNCPPKSMPQLWSVSWTPYKSDLPEHFRFALYRSTDEHPLATAERPAGH